MVMLRPKGKAEKIAKEVMKKQGIKVPPATSQDKVPLKTPYLQH